MSTGRGAQLVVPLCEYFICLITRLFTKERRCCQHVVASGQLEYNIVGPEKTATTCSSIGP